MICVPKCRTSFDVKGQSLILNKKNITPVLPSVPPEYISSVQLIDVIYATWGGGGVGGGGVGAGTFFFGGCAFGGVYAPCIYSHAMCQFLWVIQASVVVSVCYTCDSFKPYGQPWFVYSTCYHVSVTVLATQKMEFK